MALSLNADTRGETVFQEVKTYFEKNQIPLTNVIACANDGAPSMMGRYHGFKAFLKAASPDVLTISLCYSSAAFGGQEHERSS